MLDPNLKINRWVSPEKFENESAQSQYEEFVSKGSKKALKVALVCIIVYSGLTILRDIVFPPPDSALVFKQILRTVAILLSVATFTYLLIHPDIKPKTQITAANATAIVSAFFGWLIFANNGLDFTEELLGRYVTITAITMIIISTVLRCTTAVTIFVLLALYVSPINLAIPIAENYPAAIFRNVIYMTIGLVLAIFLHLTIRKKDFELFKALWETKQSLKKVTKANQSKRMFLTAIAHDYRQPLSALQTYVDLGVSLNRETSDSRQQHLMQKIQESTTTIVQNLSNLLDLTTLDQATENVKIESTNIENLVRKVMEIYRPIAEQSQTKLELILRGNEFLGSTNVQLFHQILANVISNSIKHQKTTQADRKVRVCIAQKATKIKCFVFDNGKGFVKSNLVSHISEQSNRHGYGYSIISNAISGLEDHHFHVRSQPNLYTLVVISVPKSRPTDESSPYAND